MDQTSFLSTKFWTTILVILLSYGLVFVGRLDAKTWLDMATVAAGLYQVSNLAGKAIKR